MDMGLLYHMVCFTASSAVTSTYCTYSQKEGQGELTSVAGHTLRWFTLTKIFTHPSLY